MRSLSALCCAALRSQDSLLSASWFIGVGRGRRSPRSMSSRVTDFDQNAHSRPHKDYVPRPRRAEQTLAARKTQQVLGALPIIIIIIDVPQVPGAYRDPPLCETHCNGGDAAW